jgi:hypothetical protein
VGSGMIGSEEERAVGGGASVVAMAGGRDMFVFAWLYSWSCLEVCQTRNVVSVFWWWDG